MHEIALFVMVFFMGMVLETRYHLIRRWMYWQPPQWMTWKLARKGLAFFALLFFALTTMIPLSFLTQCIFPLNAFILMPLAFVLGRYLLGPVYWRMAGITRGG